MKTNNPDIEPYRLTKRGPIVSDATWGNNGAFEIPLKGGGRLFIIASDGMGWEHVSVSFRPEKRLKQRRRTPTWDEMRLAKDLFWGEEETVMQLHPPKSTYVNNHPYTLHLWRPTNATIPLPLPEMVGVVGGGTYDPDNPQEAAEAARLYAWHNRFGAG